MIILHRLNHDDLGQIRKELERHEHTSRFLFVHLAKIHESVYPCYSDTLDASLPIVGIGR